MIGGSRNWHYRSCNGASTQHQLDVHGEVMDALHLARCSGLHSDGNTWRVQQGLRDDQLSVFRVRLAPHERLPMHDVPAHVAVWLTDAHLRIEYPDGRTEVRQFRAGQVEWVAIGKHAGENLGDKQIEFVAVERAPDAASR